MSRILVEPSASLRDVHVVARPRPADAFHVEHREHEPRSREDRAAPHETVSPALSRGRGVSGRHRVERGRRGVQRARRGVLREPHHAQVRLPRDEDGLAPAQPQHSRLRAQPPGPVESGLLLAHVRSPPPAAPRRARAPHARWLSTPHGRARADPPRSPEGFSSAGAPTFSTRLCAAPSPSTRAVAAAAAAATAAAAARAAAR